MAINPISQTDASQVAAQAVAGANTNQTQPAAKEPTPAKIQPSATVTDTVQISSSASALMQEVQETRAQTAQEAGRGDRQAQKLLVKEEAAKAVLEGSNKPPILQPK